MYNSAHPQVRAFVTALSKKLGAVTATDTTGNVAIRQGDRTLFIINKISGWVYHPQVRRGKGFARGEFYAELPEAISRLLA